MVIYIKLGLTIIIRILLSKFCLYELMDYYGYQVYYVYIYDDYNNYLGTIPSPPNPLCPTPIGGLGFPVSGYGQSKRMD